MKIHRAHKISEEKEFCILTDGRAECTFYGQIHGVSFLKTEAAYRYFNNNLNFNAWNVLEIQVAIDINAELEGRI